VNEQYTTCYNSSTHVDFLLLHFLDFDSEHIFLCTNKLAFIIKIKIKKIKINIKIIIINV